MINRIGQQYNDYRLLRLLGSGSFAEVYYGEHVRDKTPAAIKILNTRLTDEKELRGFINEARTFRLKHPHIVQLLDFGIQSDGTPFLIMAYAPGGTLRQRHPQGTILPLATIVSYVKPIAAALQHAHENNLIHRDVKPENILLGPQQEIWISDFGIAVAAHRTQSQVLQDKIGTVLYMASEQIRGYPEPASDQYALGVTVYEWLSGTYLFHGSSDIEIALQHVTAPPAPLHTHIPTISPVLEQVVHKALEKDPKQRFTSIQEFANALEQASDPKATINFSQQPTVYPPPLAPTVAIPPLSQNTLQNFPSNTPTSPLLVVNPTTADLESVSRSKKNVYTPSMQNLILKGNPSTIWKRIRRNNNERVWATNPSDEMAYIQFTEQQFELTNFTFQAELLFPSSDWTTWALVFRLHNQTLGYYLALRHHRQIYDRTISFDLKIIKVGHVILNRKLLLFQHDVYRTYELSGQQLAMGGVGWIPEKTRLFGDAPESYLLLAVVVQGSTIDLYGNLQHLVRVNDTTVASGEICLYSSENNPVRCVRTTVWTP